MESDPSCGWGGQWNLAAGFGKFLFELGDGPVRGGGPGDQQQIAASRHEILMLAEHFAQAALRAIAAGGGANGGGRGNHTDAGSGGIGGRGFAFFPPDGEGAALEAAALLPHGADVSQAAQVLLRAKAHGPGTTGAVSDTRGRARLEEANQTTVSRLRPLRRRDLMTLRPPRVAIRAR